MKIKFLIIFFLIPVVLSGQVKKPQSLPGYDSKLLHWGFTVGFSTWDYQISRVDGSNIVAEVEDPQLSFGLQVTIVSDLRLNDYFTLRFLPGLALGQTNIGFFGKSSRIVDRTQQFELAALQFPLLVKFRAQRLNNYRPYLLAGANYIYDMTGAKRGEDEILFEMNRGNLFLEFGYGIDSYLQFFKFSPEIKVGVGLFNMFNSDPTKGIPEYNSTIEDIRAFYVMFNFHFE